jgi:hypothetical protein
MSSHTLLILTSLSEALQEEIMGRAPDQRQQIFLPVNIFRKCTEITSEIIEFSFMNIFFQKEIILHISLIWLK